MDQTTPSIHNDVWVLDVASWAWRGVDVACGAVPEPRTGHTAAALGGGMCLVGGANPEAGPLGDVWILWMRSPQWFWQPVDVAPPLPARELHAMSPLPQDGDPDTLRLAVWGGRNRTGMATSLHQLCVPCSSDASPAADGVPALAGGSCTQTGTTQPGFASASHSCAMHNIALPGVHAAVFGGFDGSALAGSVSLLSTQSLAAAASADQDAAHAGAGSTVASEAVAPTPDAAHMCVASVAVQGSKAPASFASAALPHASKAGAMWVVGGLTGPQCADTVQLLQLEPVTE